MAKNLKAFLNKFLKSSNVSYKTNMPSVGSVYKVFDGVARVEHLDVSIGEIVILGSDVRGIVLALEKKFKKKINFFLIFNFFDIFELNLQNFSLFFLIFVNFSLFFYYKNFFFELMFKHRFKYAMVVVFSAIISLYRYGDISIYLIIYRLIYVNLCIFFVDSLKVYTQSLNFNPKCFLEAHKIHMSKLPYDKDRLDRWFISFLVFLGAFAAYPFFLLDCSNLLNLLFYYFLFFGTLATLEGCFILFNPVWQHHSDFLFKIDGGGYYNKFLNNNKNLFSNKKNKRFFTFDPPKPDGLLSKMYNDLPRRAKLFLGGAVFTGVVLNSIIGPCYSRYKAEERLNEHHSLDINHKKTIHSLDLNHKKEIHSLDVAQRKLNLEHTKTLNKIAVKVKEQSYIDEPIAGTTQRSLNKVHPFFNKDGSIVPSKPPKNVGDIDMNSPIEYIGFEYLIITLTVLLIILLFVKLISVICHRFRIKSRN